MLLMTMPLGSFQPERVDTNEFGDIAYGHVGPDNAPVQIYTPHEYSPADGSTDFVAAIGLLARPRQYHHLGKTLMSDNDRLVVFGHDHHYHKWPIRANAADIVSGVKALELEHFTAVGHSMGTIATLLAMEDEHFAKATDLVVQVDPAMTGNHLAYNPADIVNAAREGLTLAVKHPGDAFDYTTGAIGEYVRRPLVIAKQVLRLASGVVNDRYTELMARHPDKEYVIVYNHRDGLVPERWGNALHGQNVSVLVHDSKTGLAHAAINVDPDFAHGLHAIAHHTTMPESFHRAFSTPAELVAA